MKFMFIELISEQQNLWQCIQFIEDTLSFRNSQKTLLGKWQFLIHSIRMFPL